MYRQLFERAQKPIDKYLDLRRKTPPARTAEKPGNCLNGVPPSFAAFVAAAEKRVQEGNASGALFCYEQALLPLSVALNRSANAWYLIGNEDKAQELHRQALELNPADSDRTLLHGGHALRDRRREPAPAQGGQGLLEPFPSRGPRGDGR